MCFRLKQEVGSYALMSGTGFEQMDFLQCAKFAEGDSRILMLKMSRDRLNLFKKNGPSGDDEEDELCHTILEAVASRMKENGGDRQAAFDGEWESFYDLARLVMGRISRNYLNEQ